MVSMDSDELLTVVNAHINDARDYDDTFRKPDREKAFKFFDGEVDFPPMGPKRSKFVSKDVADTHGLILPGLMRVFFSSSKIVVYEATRPEHDEYVDQASDLVNYEIMKGCGGYRQIRDGMSDGLLVGNGVMKHWWDKSPTYRTESYSGIDEMSYRYITDNKDFAEEIEREEYPDPDWVAPQPPEMPAEVIEAAQTGDMQAIQAFQQIAAAIEEAQTATIPTLYDVKVKFYRTRGRLRVEAIPNEEFLIDRAAKTLDESVRFCAHRRRRTRSELIKEGYNKNKINDLPRYDNAFDEERDRRERDSTGSSVDVSSDRSTDFIEVFECYVLVDYDGDGIAERRRIVMAGSTGASRDMLTNEEWGDDLPFSDIVPDPIAHEWKGRSLFDDTNDIQRVKTVAIRGILDNTYQQLLPQQDVEDGAYLNMDEVYNPTFGGVRIRKSSKPMAQPVIVPYIVDKVAPVLEYMDGVAEKRTGISQRSQALDLDALQNQSATAVNAAQSAAFSKTEEYAKNIAEAGGMKRMFACCLKLITKHQDRPKVIKLRGKWVEIDPTGWDADMDVTINTGLGTGSRERDFALLQGVASKQEAIVAQFGPYNPKLNVGHVMETYQKMAEAGGLDNPDSYFPPISQEEITTLRQQQEQAAQNQPGDPRMIEIQQKYALEERKMQTQFEIQRAKDMEDSALQREKMEREFQLQTAKGVREVELQTELANIKAQSDEAKEAAQMRADLAVSAQEQAAEREKITLEYQQKLAEMAQERELELLKLGIPVGGLPDPNQSTQMLMTGIAEIGRMIAALGEHITAPVEIVRDVNGKATGTRRMTANGNVQ